jgi:hypothetical protein
MNEDFCMKIDSRLALALIIGCWTGIAACAVRAADTPGLRQGDYVAVIGDSITEQRTYSLFIEEYLMMCKPAQALMASQFGWGGETAPELAARMGNDVLPFGVTVATTNYGMNDGHYGPMDDDKAKRYTDGTQSIIDQLKKANVHLIVLGSPGVVDSELYHHDPVQAAAYNKTLAALSAIDKKLAAEQGLVYADVHDPMMDVMAKAKAKFGKTYVFAGDDGIHPYRNGHLVMAYVYLKALGCNGDIGTITVDLAGNTAQATDGHKILAVKDGAVTVESSKYPFCFYGDPIKPDSTIGVLDFFPFNDDLNRFKLVVNNAPSEKLKVAWGTKSKEFSAADLKAGINLAAEFLDNPFSRPFAEAEQKMAHQQEREIDLIKGRIHNIPGYLVWLPDKKDLLMQMRDELVQADQPLRQAAAEAVKPVTHTIVIEAVK